MQIADPWFPVVAVERLEAWEVRAEDFPAAGRPADQLEYLLRYAVLAPSARNSQPWLFKVRADVLELYADRSRGLPVSDPDDRLLTISCGAALFNLRTALRRFGYAGAIARLPRPEREDLLAEVALGRSIIPTEDDLRLFNAIPERHTNRQAFEDVPFDPEVFDELREAADAEGAWLTRLDGQDKNAACALVAEGDEEQLRDKRFRRELASWIVPNRSDRRDGVPGYAIGYSDLRSYVGPLLFRTFDTGKAKGARDQALSAGSPLLAVLGTHDDRPRDWLVAGQALERVLLTATSCGYDASFMNQPVEVERLRPRLAALAGQTGFPQMVIRMGIGPKCEATPRRDVHEILVGPAAWL